jgi:hypothetical protein
MTMPLRHMSDLSPADWFASDEPDVLALALGPTGFGTYARVLHQNDAGDRREGHLDEALLEALCGVLARHTSTPNTCYFGLWEGYGDIKGGHAFGPLVAFSGSPRWPMRVFRPEKNPPPPPPAFAPEIIDGPKVDFFHRYLLFTGPLDEAGQWGARPYGPGIRRDINSPNLMWPADHAWFVTTNFEYEWTGVGGSSALVDDLLRDPRLEVVRTRYDVDALR